MVGEQKTDNGAVAEAGASNSARIRTESGSTEENLNVVTSSSTSKGDNGKKCSYGIYDKGKQRFVQLVLINGSGEDGKRDKDDVSVTSLASLSDNYGNGKGSTSKKNVINNFKCRICHYCDGGLTTASMSAMSRHFDIFHTDIPSELRFAEVVEADQDAGESSNSKVGIQGPFQWTLEKEKEYQEYQRLIKETKLEIDTFTMQIVEKTREIKTKEKELQDKDEHLVRLNRLLYSSSQDKSSLKAENHNLKQDLKEVKLEFEVYKFNTELELERKVKQLAEMQETHQQMVSILTVELGKEQGKCKDIEFKVSKLEEEKKLLLKEKDTLKDRIKQEIQRRENLFNQFTKVSQQLQEKSCKLKEVAHTLGKTRAELKEEREAAWLRLRSETEKNNAQQRFEVSMAKIRAENDSKSNEIKRLRNELLEVRKLQRDYSGITETDLLVPDPAQSFSSITTASLSPVSHPGSSSSPPMSIISESSLPRSTSPFQDHDLIHDLKRNITQFRDKYNAQTQELEDVKKELIGSREELERTKDEFLASKARLDKKVRRITELKAELRHYMEASKEVNQKEPISRLPLSRYTVADVEQLKAELIESRAQLQQANQCLDIMKEMCENEQRWDLEIKRKRKQFLIEVNSQIKKGKKND